MRRIISKNNPKYKELLLNKKNCAKDRNTNIFIEGVRLCKDALFSGVVFNEILISESYQSQFDQAEFKDTTDLIVLDEILFQRLCSTRNPQGIAAIVKSPAIGNLEELSVKAEDRYIICESIQDPGNLGSIIRTADAFGFTGIIITSGTVDPFNEKVLRSSMGSIFHIEVVYSKSMNDLFLWLKNNNISTYAAHLKGADLTKESYFNHPCAIVIGNEGKGLTEEITDRCEHLIRIPMKGEAESLNVSVATVILCYLVSTQ